MPPIVEFQRVQLCCAVFVGRWASDYELFSPIVHIFFCKGLGYVLVQGPPCNNPLALTFTHWSFTKPTCNIQQNRWVVTLHYVTSDNYTTHSERNANTPIVAPESRRRRQRLSFIHIQLQVLHQK